MLVGLPSLALLPWCAARGRYRTKTLGQLLRCQMERRLKDRIQVLVGNPICGISLCVETMPC